MSMMFELRSKARRSVSGPMVVWALIMMVVLCMWEAHGKTMHEAELVGVVASLLFGAFLGWQRRAATAYLAPLVSWVFAWLPLWVTAMVRHGFFRGLFTGLFLVTVGWLLIGFLEFALVGAAALVVRLLRGRDRAAVTIFPPQ